MNESKFVGWISLVGAIFSFLSLINGLLTPWASKATIVIFILILIVFTWVTNKTLRNDEKLSRIGLLAFGIFFGFLFGVFLTSSLYLFTS